MKSTVCKEFITRLAVGLYALSKLRTLQMPRDFVVSPGVVSVVAVVGTPSPVISIHRPTSDSGAMALDLRLLYSSPAVDGDRVPMVSSDDAGDA